MLLNSNHGCVTLTLSPDEADRIRAGLDLAAEHYAACGEPGTERFLWYETASELLKAGSMIAFAYANGPAGPDLFLEPPDLLQELPAAD
jgi:hypothetical protein